MVFPAGICAINCDLRPLKDSLVRLLSKFLSTAFLNLFLGTDTRNFIEELSTGSINKKKMRKGKSEKERPLSNKRLINFLLWSRSCFGNLALVGCKCSDGNFWRNYGLNYLRCFLSSETDNFLRPLALLLANTLLPPGEAILSLYPCLFFLFLTDGWKVLFIIYRNLGLQNYSIIEKKTKQIKDLVSFNI